MNFIGLVFFSKVFKKFWVMKKWWCDWVCLVVEGWWVVVKCLKVVRFLVVFSGKCECVV